jgi:hypothetical protein
MRNLEAFYGISVIFLTIITIIIAAKEKERARKQAFKEGHQQGFSRGYGAGRHRGLCCGGVPWSPIKIT